MIAASVVISSGQIIALAIPALIGVCVLLIGLLQLANKQPDFPALSRIAGIDPGDAMVCGPVTGPYTISSPIGGKACYLYRTAVWQRERSQTAGWKELAEETLHVPFFVGDQSGRLLVEPLGASLEIPIGLREEYSAASFYGASTIPPALYAFLARHRITPTNSILIEESCIEANSNLFVSGTVMENPGIEVRPLSPKKANGFKPGGKMSNRDEPEVVQLSSMTSTTASDAKTQQSRIAAALLKAGIQNPNAWAAAGVAYPGPASATAVLQEEHPPEKPSEATSGFDLKPRLVMMKSAEGVPFVLSSRRIKLPAQSSRRKGLLLVSIGGTLTLASFWILLTRFLR